MRSVLVSRQLMRKAMPKPVGRPLVDDSVDHRPIELSFLGFKVSPCQTDVEMVHARELQQVRIPGDLVLVRVVVGEMVIPAFVRIRQAACAHLRGAASQTIDPVRTSPQATAEPRPCGTASDGKRVDGVLDDEFFCLVGLLLSK